MEKDTFETTFIIENTSAKAIMVLEAGDTIWLPLSQIKVNGEKVEEADLEIGELVTVEMPEWLARKKGLF